MTFDEKVTLLRSLPKFKVAPISDIRAIAFVLKEKETIEDDDAIVGQKGNIKLCLTHDDIGKILREYPDLEDKLR
ncbi:MAG TPA: hypothetical protein VHE53_04785 [Patescibacteria group bacterium]|nr:hypothetical protein [Patescibacteria group bacterium]